jgi:hypothetical protein
VVIHTSLKLGEEDHERLRTRAAAVVYKDPAGQHGELATLIAQFADLVPAK